MLSDAQEACMIALAELAAPNEAWGFIAKDGAVISMKNVAAEPRKNFEGDPAEVEHAFSRHKIVGVWHSHPGGRVGPSENDIAMHPKGLRMFIVVDGEVYDHGYPND